jgi:hypothetical protein
MATKRSFIKPLNYPAPTPEQMRHDASTLIHRRFGGSLNGLERRELARASSDPALREAARVLDAHDAMNERPSWIAERYAQRPQSVVSAQQARGQLAAGSGPSGEGVAARSPEPVANPGIHGLRQSQTGKLLTPDDHGSRPSVEGSNPSQATRRPLMQPSALRREINGRYLSPKSMQVFAGVRRLLRDLRESGNGGGAA